MLGQEHVVRALTHALESGRLHHAYLFTGTRGVGKTTLARILAKCLNCARGVGPAPCGECEPCREIDAGRFGDLLEVDAATNTRVEEMRELLDNSQYLPVTGRFKVYIIDEVHMLSRHAFNAMLKTLEEPPAHMKFILATTDPHKVPVTVLSRCLQFSLKPMTVEQLVSRLAHILEAEQVPFEPAALRLVARAAHGSVRDSLSVLDQAIAFGAGRVDEAPVADLLGVAAGDAVLGLAQALAALDGSALLGRLDALIASGQDADGLLQDFARLMQQVALHQLAGAPAEGSPTDAALADLAQALDPPSVQLCYQIALNGRRDLVHAPDEPAGLSMTLLRMLAFLRQGASGPARTAEPARAGPRPPPPSAGAPRATPAAPGSPIARLPAEPAAARPAPGNPVSANPAPAHPASAIPAPARPAMANPAPVRPASAAPAAAATVRQAPPVEPPASAAMAPPAALPDTAADWLEVVDQLPPAGVALELARHCVWRGRDGSRLRLGMAQGHKALLGSQERLQALLAQRLGPIQLEITLEELGVETAPEGSVASRDAARRAQRLAEAGASLEADPVVQALLREPGARIVPGSIRPRDEAA